MAAVDFLLKLDGIDGESADVGHVGDLLISSFSKHAHSPRDIGTGMATGKIIWDDAQFTMRLDRAFPLLVKALAENIRIKSATLVCRKSGGADTKTGIAGQEFLKITYNDAMMTKVTVRGSTDEDPTPFVDFSFAYAKITEEYRSQQQTGTLGGTVMYTASIGAGA